MNETGFSGDGITNILATLTRRKYLRKLDRNNSDLMYCLEIPPSPKIPIAKAPSARAEILRQVAKR